MQKPYIENVEDVIFEYFNNRYVYMNPIAAGGMGSVYLIKTNDRFNLYRALKIVEKSDQEVYGEIYALKELNHPGIPKIIEVIETEDYILIVQELVNGKSLKDIIEENGMIDEEFVLLWIQDLSDILTYLHEHGFIHRDIKPSNIMISDQGEVKLIDFGLAKEMSTIDRIDNEVIGTRNYTAPERYSKRPADKRSDIYGFGTTCYYLATGQVPLEVTSSSKRPLKQMQKNLDIVKPVGLRKIIEKSIAFNPDKRYQDFKEIRYNLSQIDAFNQAVEKNEKKRKFYLTGIIILFLLSFVTIASGFAYKGYEDQQHYESLIATGEEYYNSQNYKDALNAYQEAIDFNKNQLSGYQGLYETQTRMGDYDEVISEITELFNNNPEAAQDQKLEYLLGNAYYETGEYGQAEKYLNDAIQKEPTIENYLVLGLTYSEQGKYDQAQQVIDDLQKAGGDVNTSTYLSGQISVRQGNNNEAIDSFKKVISSTGDNSLKQRAVRSLSDLYQDTKDYGSQIEILESVKNDPTLSNDYQLKEMLAESYYNMAENEDSNDYYNLALKEFSQLKDSGYDQPYIYRNIAIIDQALDRYDDAEEVLDEMEETYPEDAQANIQKAWLVLESQEATNEKDRNYEDFVTEYEKAVDKDDGTNSSEIQMLEDRYDELKEKGWL